MLAATMPRIGAALLPVQRVPTRRIRMAAARARIPTSASNREISDGSRVRDGELNVKRGRRRPRKYRFQSLPFHGLFQNVDRIVAPVDAFPAISGDEHERNA